MRPINEITPKKLLEYPFIMTVDDIRDYLGCSKAYVSKLFKDNQDYFIIGLGIKKILITKEAFGNLVSILLCDDKYAEIFDKIFWEEELKGFKNSEKNDEQE